MEFLGARILRCSLVMGVLCALAAGCGGKSKRQDDPIVSPPREPSDTHGLCSSGEFRCAEERLLVCNDAADAWQLLDTCRSADDCEASEGRCRVCEPGAVRCNGALREGCAEDGSSWETLEMCNAVEECNSTICEPCISPGAVACFLDDPESDNATVLSQCVPGRGWRPLDVCETQALCERTVDTAIVDATEFQGVCVPPVCEAGSLRCVDRTLERCSAGRDQYHAIELCETAEICQLMAATQDPSTITECPTPCAPAGAYRCDGQRLLRCHDDQTGEEEVSVCPDGRTCDPMRGECLGPCIPGDMRCNNATLETCNSSQEWQFTEQCASRALCSLTAGENELATAECLPKECDAGEYVCTAGALTRCNDELTDLTLIEICFSPQWCDATSGRCITPHCLPGERRCNPTSPQQLEECNAVLTGWDVVTTCIEGQTCNSLPAIGPDCLEDCPDPAFRCLGAALQSCSDDTGAPVWSEISTCATAELCELGLAQGSCQTPACGGVLADYNCLGSVLQTCSDDRTGWTDSRDCALENLVCDAGPDGDGPAGCF